jgi:Fe-S-cluster containining protein
MDCSCERCQHFCHNKPGWFTPDQIRPLADRLGMAIDELFRRYLTIDTVLLGDRSGTKAIYVLAPAINGRNNGSMSQPTDHGTCIWFKDGGCGIHPAKPLECRLADHTTTRDSSNTLRASILAKWVSQKQIVQDLYRKKLKPPQALKRASQKARSLRREAGR